MTEWSWFAPGDGGMARGGITVSATSLPAGGAMRAVPCEADY